MSGFKIIEGTPEASPGPRKRILKKDRITGTNKCRRGFTPVSTLKGHQVYARLP